MTDWVTMIAWQTSVACMTSFNATIIQALVVLNYPDYDVQRWHGTLIFYTIIAVALFVTTYLGRAFPKFEAIILTLHVAGFFAISITVTYLASKSDKSEVFQAFINGGGFSTDGQSFLVGSVSVIFAFNGENLPNRPQIDAANQLQVLMLQYIWVYFSCRHKSLSRVH